MLSSPNRLSLRSHRKQIEEKGKVIKNFLFTVPYLTLQSLPSPQFAFIITKKSFATSVERHKVKRILSQIIRNNLSSFGTNTQAIIIPSYKIKAQTLSQIEESLVSILKSI